ncbi:MAG: T9SS type A sorting domain-containing protein [Bacteroidetes bacterium]|nr:T9SS type A sorting domain-containing protein [Bacteroidota bacterium]
MYIGRFFLPFIFFIFSFDFSHAQTTPRAASQYIENNYEAWGLSREDIQGLDLKSQSQSKHNEVIHLYFQQNYKGIEIKNSLLVLSMLEEGKVFHAGSRLHSDIENKITSFIPKTSAKDALHISAKVLGGVLIETPRFIKQKNDHIYLYEKGELSLSTISVQLLYLPKNDGKLHLAWQIQIEKPDALWNIVIDAANGDLIEKKNKLLHCHFPHATYRRMEPSCEKEDLLNSQNSANLTPDDNSLYNVFPYPVESPIHGEQQIISAPADPIASPYGWHDTNGLDGAEHTITRGNNVHAYLDKNGNNASSGDEPNGGENLSFLYSFSPNSEPAVNQNASVTQLFYACNFLHDFSYHYGFDEESGNFQENNYEKGGIEGDYLKANAQDGSAGSSINNARFWPYAEGISPRIEMFLWNRSGLLTVESPVNIAGIYETREAQFGQSISETAVTGELVITDDGSMEPTQGCNEIINDVDGKIALIDRGTCDYSVKVLNAQNAGAIAVIVCSYNGGTFNPMGSGEVGNQVSIPSVLVNYADCQVIRQYIDEGVIVSLVTPDDEGPTQIDGSFDNGIIAHEYGHGISQRLTGGPQTVSCLDNDEQMGEGISDFFALAATAKTGDAGEMPRGIGTYVYQQAPNGPGSRRYPYSTNMNVNPLTFHDIVGTNGVYPVGEVWASVLWDLYWVFSGQYGWSEDLLNGDKGNNIAIQLVMGGMKMQPCDPGLLEARDAILAADMANNEGANQCLIWEVFARRGLGWDAEQGSTTNRHDGKAGFLTNPECIKELKITKTATEIINAGDEITLQITVTNHKEVSLADLIITDIIPEGLTYVPGTASEDASVNEGVITFELDFLASGASHIVSYRVLSSADNFSVRQFFDDMENGDDEWTFFNQTGDHIWYIRDANAYSGENAWFVEDTGKPNDQLLQLQNPVLVTGDQPVLRFYHKYNTEWGFDGGIVQISNDGGIQWENVEDYMFKNGYNSRLSFFTLGINDLKAFIGNSEGYIDTYIDLEAYKGDEISIRFRFGSDDNGTGNEGWYMDDFEIMDMFNYQAEVCVISAEGDQACALPPHRGTIVQPNLNVPTREIDQSRFRADVFPNPSKDFLNIRFNSKTARDVEINLVDVNGKVVYGQIIHLNTGQQLIPLSTAHLVAGFYFLQLKSEGVILTKKLIIQ